MSEVISLEKRTVSKVFWRLMPFLGLLYIIAFLDRVNVGYAALSMNKDLGFSNAVYGLGAGIFFIGYFVMEVPGNILLAKVGARLWIARILISAAQIRVVTQLLFVGDVESPFRCAIVSLLDFVAIRVYAKNTRILFDGLPLFEKCQRMSRLTYDK